MFQTGDSGEAPIVLTPTVGLIPLAVTRPTRYEMGAGYNGCGSVLLLKVADDAYVVYAKLGGP